MRPSCQRLRKGSIMIGSRALADALTAWAADSRVAAVAASSKLTRTSILAKSRPEAPSTSKAVKRSSISKTESRSPPRFIDPTASLLSSLPSTARSSRMSGVPSTPSTAGLSSAVAMRSSSRYRSAIADGSRPAASAPRAGWSAATMNSLPSSGNSARRGRSARARATLSGDSARTRRSSSKSDAARVAVARTAVIA